MAEFNTCANLIDDAEKVKELEQMYEYSRYATQASNDASQQIA